MSRTLQIENWLITAFEEPVNCLNESFYFDKLSNQFFSIFITDYLFLDEEAPPNIQSPYSDADFQVLNDRLKRIELSHSSIVHLPRLTVEERKHIIRDFLRNNSAFFDDKKIQFYIDNETGRNQFDISELSEELKPEWKKFKASNILRKVESFCMLNRIDIESSLLWTEHKVTTLDIDLTGEESINMSQRTKSKMKVWWKFW